MNTETLKLAWANSDHGGKAILAGLGVAICSMLLPWVDIGIASSNGISQGTFLLLGLWFHPVQQLLRSEEIDQKIGFGCGIGGVLLTIGFIESQSFPAIFGNAPGNASGIGAYLFFLTCCALIYGVYSHKPSTPPAVSSQV
jgi:hypothetical protein